MKIVKKKIKLKNCHFYSRERSLYIAWACFVMVPEKQSCASVIIGDTKASNAHCKKEK